MKKNAFIFIALWISVGLSHAATSGSAPPDLCEAEPIIKTLRRSFRKVIPDYNPNTISIEINTESKLKIRPTDPILNDFLLHFDGIGNEIIYEKESKIQFLRHSLLTVLSYEYSEFLHTYGRPLSCTSYLLGSIENFKPVSLVYKKSLNLKKFFDSNILRDDKNKANEHFAPWNGKEIIKRLGAVVDNTFNATGKKLNHSLCTQLVIESKNDGNLIKYPTISSLPRSIKIPGQPTVYNGFKNNVTHSLEKYYQDILSCLENDALRSEFSANFATWMSEKLIPPLLQARVCAKGFPRILILLASAESYGLQPKKVNPVKDMSDPEDYDYGEYLSPNQDYVLEPVEAVPVAVPGEPEATAVLPDSITNSTVISPRHSDEEMVASASAAIVFLLVFTCFLPLLFMLYYFYIKEGAPSKANFRRWLLKRLGAADTDNKNLEAEPKQSLDNEETLPLIQSPGKENRAVKSLKATPKDTTKFRENSRDIYIKMADYPMNISIEEKETSDDGSSSPDISDELHITSGVKPKITKKLKSEKKAAVKPVYTRLYDINDSEESEEMFSKFDQNRDIHDFTSWRPKGRGRTSLDRQYSNSQRVEQNRQNGTSRTNKVLANKSTPRLPLQRPGNPEDEEEDEDDNAGLNSRDSQSFNKENSSRNLFDIS